MDPTGAEGTSPSSEAPRSETRDVETLILGAGPGGLACAYRLVKDNARPVVVERGAKPGGLMRNIERGDFSVDLGRKELYSRIIEVHDLWTDLLGDDYVPYDHREGILYDGHVLETSSRWRGKLRGMPPMLAVKCLCDMLWTKLRLMFRSKQNYEEYWHAQRGSLLSRILSQGYEEKFNGVLWVDVPVPDESGGSGSTGPETKPSPGTQGPKKPDIWRHPALGSGQIPAVLAERVEAAGGELALSTNVTALEVADGRVTAVRTQAEGKEVIYRPKWVVSSLPPHVLAGYLDVSVPAPATPAPSHPRRGVVLVYVFGKQPPLFPHAWLRVTCPKLRCGRIVNYAAFGGRMVPTGQTALCVEFFCAGDDPLIKADDEERLALALEELSSAGLFEPSTLIDSLVLTLPHADAATSWRDWRSPLRTKLTETVGALGNLIDIQRPGTDKATAAGLLAADAILRDDDEHFDREAARIGGALEQRQQY